MMISAVILHNGEEDQKLLKKSLDSVKWCDEIIQVDTNKIKGSFAEWRNEGMKKAKSDWVLYIDSDEIVTDQLKIEILKLIENCKLKIEKCFVAYAIPRRNFIFGQEFKYSGQYPDYQKRLFLKSKFKNWKGDLHEEPVLEGELGHLKNPLIHYKNITISQMLDKTNKWSEIEAKLLFDAGHPKMNYLRFASAGLREFTLRMFKQMAFMDGTKGIIYAIYQVYSKLITYSKLWEMQLK